MDYRLKGKALNYKTFRRSIGDCLSHPGLRSSAKSMKKKKLKEKKIDKLDFNKNKNL